MEQDLDRAVPPRRASSTAVSSAFNRSTPARRTSSAATGRAAARSPPARVRPLEATRPATSTLATLAAADFLQFARTGAQQASGETS